MKNYEKILKEENINIIHFSQRIRSNSVSLPSNSNKHQKLKK